MDDRVATKINEIQKFLMELENTVPPSFEDYMNDYVKKGFCERYFEKIIEAITDLSFIIIKQNALETPEDDISSFFVLSKNKIISEKLAIRLKSAKGMRNVLVHEYGEINDELVYGAVSEKLIQDTQEFLDFIKKITEKDS